MKLGLFLVLFSFVSIGATAQFQTLTIPNPATQKDYAIKCVVPFNDNGNWCWSDTLGNIIIPAQFKKTTFFYQTALNLQTKICNKVETDFGENIYILNEGLLLPEKLNIVQQFKTQTKTDLLFVVQNQDNKYGLYDANEKVFLIETAFDTISIAALTHSFFYFKNHSDTVFQQYSLKNKVIEKTAITAIQQYTHQKGMWSTHVVVTFQDKKFKELQYGKIVDTRFDGSELWSKERINTQMDGGYETTFKPTSTDKILETFDQSRNKVAPKYGFSKLVVWSKNGKVGVLNEKEEEIIPIIYDKIIFTNQRTVFQLYKDGKMGKKMLFSHSPIIEAKYDWIGKSPNRLWVRRGWIFEVYPVKIDGEINYVGENGVEYFNLGNRK